MPPNPLGGYYQYARYGNQRVVPVTLNHYAGWGGPQPPHPPPTMRAESAPLRVPVEMQRTATLRNDMNLNPNSLKISEDPVDPGYYNISFICDCSIAYSVSIFFMAKEQAGNALVCLPTDTEPVQFPAPTPRQYFPKGLGTHFKQPPGARLGLNVGLYHPQKLMHPHLADTEGGEEVFPIIVRLEADPVAIPAHGTRPSALRLGGAPFETGAAPGAADASGNSAALGPSAGDGSYQRHGGNSPHEGGSANGGVVTASAATVEDFFSSLSLSDAQQQQQQQGGSARGAGGEDGAAAGLSPRKAKELGPPGCSTPDWCPSQTTYAMLVPDGDGFKVKVVKQKIWVEGVSYELQQIYGIDSSPATGVPASGDAADSNKDCVICLSEPRDTTVLPCRHMCMCHECARALRDNRCPICRAPVQSLLEIKVEGRPASAGAGPSSAPAASAAPTAAAGGPPHQAAA
eukprot:jgi/Mesvir1/12395/Mv00568-RA.1